MVTLSSLFCEKVVSYQHMFQTFQTGKRSSWESVSICGVGFLYFVVICFPLASVAFG